MPPQRHEWIAEERVSGALCLELTNTVGDHSKTRDIEHLPDWEAVLEWGEAAGAFGRADAQALRKIANRQPSSAQRALRTLLKYREAFFRVASALAADRAPDGGDLAQVEATILDAVRSAHLVRQANEFRWAIEALDAPFNLPLFRVALSALSLLQGKELTYLRECQRCSWLFIDRSKSHGRRWCRPEACGNRARVARHYHAKSR